MIKKKSSLSACRDGFFLSLTESGIQIWFVGTFNEVFSRYEKKKDIESKDRQIKASYMAWYSWLKWE